MNLSLDVWSHIAMFIVSNQDKCRLMMTCKNISKCNFYFDQPIYINKILRSQWFDYFRNVSNVFYADVLPKFVNKINFCSEFNGSINNIIPSSVKQLIFYGNDNVFCGNAIPTTVTHLGLYRNNWEKGMRITVRHFPPSVTHLILNSLIYAENITARYLKFTKDFKEKIKDAISEYTTYLTFYESYNRYEKDCIPSWIKKVTIIGNPSKERIEYIQQFIPENCKLLIRSHY